MGGNTHSWTFLNSLDLVFFSNFFGGVFIANSKRGSCGIAARPPHGTIQRDFQLLGTLAQYEEDPFFNER